MGGESSLSGVDCREAPSTARGSKSSCSGFEESRAVCVGEGELWFSFWVWEAPESGAEDNGELLSLFGEVELGSSGLGGAEACERAEAATPVEVSECVVVSWILVGWAEIWSDGRSVE